MKVSSLEAIFSALNEAHARYLVVGGLAVVAHGYIRMTEDLDLVLDLSDQSLLQALITLKNLGYRPIYSVPIEDFGDAELRRTWMETRNMKVFSMISDQFPDVTIDLFPKEPFDFESEFRAGVWKELAPQIQAHVVSFSALIALKTEADRHKDRDDIENLRKLHPDET